MIEIHGFGPAFGPEHTVPDPSPFVIKGRVLLKMSGLEHRFVSGDVRKAPKKKFPVIVDGEEVIADSFFIRRHIEQKYTIDFDEGLSEAEKARSWAIQKMMEDHLYWALMSERWMVEENFARGPKKFFDVIPALMRPLVVKMVLRDVRTTLYFQGFGRHSREELITLATPSIDAVATLLGDKPFIMGDSLSGGDATLYAFMESLLCGLFDSPLTDHALKKPNLVAYRDRLREQFFPDL